MEQLSAAEYKVASVVARESVFTLAGAERHRTRSASARGGSGSWRGAACNAERLRLRAEMIRVADGAELWIEDVMVERGRIIELERELVNRVSSRIRCGSLSIAAVAAAGATHELAQHGEAHELYLRAHHEWQTLERHRMQDAMGRLQRAIDLDPSFIAARADLAHLCVSQAFYGFMSPAAAASVVRGGGASSGAEWERGDVAAAMGWIRFHVDRNLRGSGRVRALVALAARSFAHVGDHAVRTMFLLSRHRFDEALGLLREAIQADPYSPCCRRAGVGAAPGRRGRGERRSNPQSNLAIHRARRSSSLWRDDSGVQRRSRAGGGAGARLASRSAHFDLATSAHAYALACAGRKRGANAAGTAAMAEPGALRDEHLRCGDVCGDGRG